MGNEGKEALEAIMKEKMLTPEVEEILKKHIGEFKKSFAV